MDTLYRTAERLPEDVIRHRLFTAIFEKEYLKNCLSKFPKPLETIIDNVVKSIVEFDATVECIDTFMDKWTEGIESVYVSNICIDGKTQVNTLRLGELSKVFGIPKLSLFASYQVHGGRFIDVARPFKVKALAYYGICYTEKSLNARHHINMKSPTKMNASKIDRIRSESIALGLK